MTTPLTETAYEQIRAAIFDTSGSVRSAAEARQSIAAAIVANPLPLMMWLTTDIITTVTFRAPNDITVTITPKEPS